MISNIINMADKTTDREDELLQSLFAAEPVEDDGFSDRVVRKLRVRIWVQRLTLPVAALIGFAVAINPLMDLLALMPSLASMVPARFAFDIGSALPATPSLVVGGLLLIGGLGALQLLDD